MFSDTSNPNVPESPSSLQTRREIWLALVVIVIAAVAAYHNSFPGVMVFDDRPSIIRNDSIRDLGNLRKIVSPPLDSTVNGRPLANVTLAINYAISGLEPWSYHVVNLAIHVCAGLLLFGVLRRTLELPSLDERIRRAAVPLALAAAVLWLVHPLQTESVTYIIQRVEALMGLFYLLTLYCFLRSVDGERPVKWQVATVLACLLAVTSKEVAVSRPVCVRWIGRRLIAGSFAEAWRRRRGLYLGLFLTWVPLALMVAGAQNRGDTAGFGTASAWHYLLTQCRAIVLYLRLSVLPHPLSFDYGKGLITEPLVVAPQAIFLVILALLTAWGVWRRSPWSLAGFWFFAVLAPSSSVVPIATQTMAEHRMYLPLLAIIVPVVCGAYLRLGRRSFVGWTAIAVVLGGMTVKRNVDYHSDLALWTATAATQPNNPRAVCDLGEALFQLGRKDEAIPKYREALRLNADYFEAHNNLGVALLASDNVAEAQGHFEHAVRLQPEYSPAYSNLGMIHYAQGRMEEALKYCTKAVELQPDFTEARSNLCVVLQMAGRFDEAIEHGETAVRQKPEYAEAHSNLGMAYFAKDRREDALRHYKEAVRLKPDFVEAHVNLGMGLLGIGQEQDGVNHLVEALRLNPANRQAHAELAKWLTGKGRLEDALQHYLELVRLAPDAAEHHFDLGNTLIKLRRMAEAVGPCSEAVRLKPEQAEAHSNLATALFFSGKPEDAIKHFEEAIRLKPDYAKAHYFLGNTLASLGRTPEARAHYEKALKISPDYRPAKESLARLEGSAAVP